MAVGSIYIPKAQGLTISENKVIQLTNCPDAISAHNSLLHWHCFTVWLQSYIQQNRCAWGVIMHQWHCCRERENGSYFTYTCYVFSPLQILTTTASNSNNIARTKVQAGRDNDTLAVRWPRVQKFMWNRLARA